MTYNFNQMWEPQLFDQTLDDSEIGGTAWNVMFFCYSCYSPNSLENEPIKSVFKAEHGSTCL